MAAADIAAKELGDRKFVALLNVRDRCVRISVMSLHSGQSSNWWRYHEVSALASSSSPQN